MRHLTPFPLVRIWDRPDDNPKPEVRRLMHEDELNKIIQLNNLSLQRFIGIDDELWIWPLKRCDLVDESGDGKVSITSEEKWITFFTTYEIDAEVASSSPLKTGKRGRKGANWYNNVNVSVWAKKEQQIVGASTASMVHHNGACQIMTKVNVGQWRIWRRWPIVIRRVRKEWV